MRPKTNRTVSRNACSCEPPRPSTQVPMNGRQVAVQAVRPSDAPSSHTVNSVVCCGNSDGFSRSFILCLRFVEADVDDALFRHAFGRFQLHPLLVVLARGAEQLDAEEPDLDHVVVRAELGAASAQGAILVERLVAVLAADLVNVHRARLLAHSALLTLL